MTTDPPDSPTKKQSLNQPNHNSLIVLPSIMPLSVIVILIVIRPRIYLLLMNSPWLTGVTYASSLSCMEWGDLLIYLTVRSVGSFFPFSILFRHSVLLSLRFGWLLLMG